MMQWFRDKMADPDFASAVRSDYTRINRTLIEVLLGEREGEPGMLFRALSDFQFTRFREMIPDAALDTWI